MNIIYKKNTLYFNDIWQKYLDNNYHSFSNTLNNIKYIYSYTHFIDDISFIVIKNNIPLGIAFIPIENNNGIKSITISNGYVPMPLAVNNKTEKFIFKTIETIVKENNIKLIKFQQDISQTIINNIQFNSLKKYNFLETNTLNGYIDLTVDKSQLWANLTKSFKSLINKYIKNNKYSFYIMNQSNYNYKIIKEFYALHCEVAHKNARGIELYNENYNLIKNNKGTLFCVYDNTKLIHCSMFINNIYDVSYSSSVTKKGLEREYLSHIILWNANIYFKEKGFRYIQYSQPYQYDLFTGIDDISSSKELNISSFKRNMGSIPITQYRGIKFYDKILLKSYLDNFYNKYINHEQTQ